MDLINQGAYCDDLQKFGQLFPDGADSGLDRAPAVTFPSSATPDGSTVPMTYANWRSLYALAAGMLA